MLDRTGTNPGLSITRSSTPSRRSSSGAQIVTLSTPPAPPPAPQSARPPARPPPPPRHEVPPELAVVLGAGEAAGDPDDGHGAVRRVKTSGCGTVAGWWPGIRARRSPAAPAQPL